MQFFDVQFGLLTRASHFVNIKVGRHGVLHFRVGYLIFARLDIITQVVRRNEGRRGSQVMSWGLDDDLADRVTATHGSLRSVGRSHSIYLLAAPSFALGGGASFLFHCVCDSLTRVQTHVGLAEIFR